MQPQRVAFDSAQGAENPIIRVARSAGTFVLRFLEMCIVMCAGGFALSFAFFGVAAWAGTPDFVERFAPIAMLVIGINMAIAMAAWMAFRGHPWRHNVEMSSTSIVAAVALVVAYSLGLIRVEASLGWFSQFAAQCGPSCLLMAAYMLWRHEHYTERGMRHQHTM